MRLATVRESGGHTRLYAASRAEDLYFDVAAVLGPAMAPQVDVRDIASLYRAGPDAVEAVRALTEAGDPHNRSSGLELTSLDLAPPVTQPRSIVCVGRNYREHLAEDDSSVPEFPVLFSKFPNTLVGHGDVVIRHSITAQLDYEGELAVVIGRPASKVPRADAMSYVAGYTVLNDISARDLQRGDLQWIRGKSLDTFCPIGPVFVSADEIRDVTSLLIQTRVNGELRQNAHVSEMIFPIPELLAFITEAITLQPGDIVATGTPAGTALGQRPPVWLQPGDVVDVSISELGTLSSVIGQP